MSTEERFLVKVEKTSSCWIWKAGKTGNGYGAFVVRENGIKKQKPAHRVAYELFVGNIPKGKLLLHSCDNRKCVNPSHLKPGSYKENSEDMVKKGRSARGARCHSTRLTTDSVIKIRTLASKGIPKLRLSRMFGVDRCAIQKVVNRVTWKYL